MTLCNNEQSSKSRPINGKWVNIGLLESFCDINKITFIGRDTGQFNDSIYGGAVFSNDKIWITSFFTSLFNGNKNTKFKTIKTRNKFSCAKIDRK